MPVDATWTTPITLEKAVGATLLAADVNKILSNLNKLGGTTGAPNGGGLTGATAATRYVGGTASGAPASGTFAVGDFVIDQTGKVHICTVAGTPGTWTTLGALTTAEANLAADVAMASANTAYDGPSLTLTTGSYDLDGGVTVLAPAAGGNPSEITAKLWNGTTVESSGQHAVLAARTGHIHLSGRITVPGAAETWKISASSDQAGATIKAAAPANPAGNTASYLRATKVG